MNSTFLKLHLAVFIAGFTGLFGRLISLNALWISFFRMTIGGVCFYLFLRCTDRLKPLPGTLKYGSMATGALLSLHITCFYLAIKLSNVSIGTLTISTISFFVALIEPMVSRTKLSFTDICYSLIAILGLSFIFSFDARYRLGIGVGIFCAFLSAVYSVCNKRLMSDPRADSYNMLNWQFLGASLMMTVAVVGYRLVTGGWALWFDVSDMLYLLLAATVCTAGMYLLQLMVLKDISAFTVMLTYNLEPVYTIVLAFLIFHENREFNYSFYVGLALIVISVGLKSWKVMRLKKLDPGLKDA